VVTESPYFQYVAPESIDIPREIPYAATESSQVVPESPHIASESPYVAAESADFAPECCSVRC
jgi:hypothetical protein